MKALSLLKIADVNEAMQNSGSAVKNGIMGGIALGTMTTGVHYGSKFLNNKLTNAINSGKITDEGQLAMANKISSGLGKIQNATSLRGIGNGISRVGKTVSNSGGLLNRAIGLGKSLLKGIK